MDPSIVAKIKGSGHPTADYIFAKIRNRESPLTAHIGKIEDAYQNYAHAGGKALLCIDNKASRDALFREGRADRLFMSVALAETCAWGGLGSCRPRLTTALTTV
jgi:hypothetical protein